MLRRGAQTLGLIRQNSTKTRPNPNLGSTIAGLNNYMPNMLTVLPPDSLISKSIKFRLLPISHPNLPVLEGKIPYYTALKTSQFLLSNFTKSKIDITKTVVKQPDEIELRAITKNFKIVYNWQVAINDKLVNGVSIYELNDACDEVIVHTIEDVEIIDTTISVLQ